MPSRKPSADVVVVGGGVIGLSIAWLAHRQGLSVMVIDAGLPGAASKVAAGLLAPSLGTLPPAPLAAFRRAAAGYPEFLSQISAATGALIPVGRGILEVALEPEGVQDLDPVRDPSARALTPRQVAELAPELVPVSGGALHALDGWIEPAALMDALGRGLPANSIRNSRVVRMEISPSRIGVRLDSGETIDGGHVVIAGGSWSPLILDLPTRLPIEPAHGEVLVLETAHSMSVAVACGDSYLVPRDGAIVVGATMEFRGFDAEVTPRGLATLEARASMLLRGALARAKSRKAWAGLRPMTPDKLPIIDRDHSDQRLIYACGHGKNGLLLAGLTAECVVDLVRGNPRSADDPFRLSRFKTS